MPNIRNVAIIAHVDHGKTTLVDSLLRQSNTQLTKELSGADLIMDSNDLEKERGITIFSKNASVQWNGTKINIIDTPGHADFGGEVERVLKMADGCLLLVDAKEGPMPQTRFVLRKALEMKLKVIVVVNKIDKPDARINEVLNRTFDLFIELGADDATADFPIVYAAAKLGKAGLEPKLDTMTDISPIFEAIMQHIAEPQVDETKPLQMLITTITADNFKGRIATGRIYNGSIKAGQTVMHIDRDGKQKPYKLTAVMTFAGLNRVETDGAVAGDVVAIAGIPEINIGETIADVDQPQALPVLMIEEPTVKMTFSVNDSPFTGKEGEFTTSRQVRERLMKELETDMALRVADGPQGNWIVSGRGELHLAILIERMRREGYELQVSRPQVIVKEIDGKKMVPYDQVFIEVPDEYSGAVIQKLGSRHGEMQNMTSDGGITFLEFIIPTRGLFGYRNEFLTDTRGLGIINTLFYQYMPDPGNWKERDQGSLVAHETGQSNLYGLRNVQDRGVMFIGPGVDVYKGQVVGQHARQGDLAVNVCKAKQLSNMRSKGDGSDEHFKTPRTMDLDAALEYIGDDELVEVTPKNVRIRKVVLDKADQRRKEMGL
jgi:GTP-binding protein